MSTPKLPPGLRFMPTEPELLKFLKDKLLGHLDEIVSGFISDNVDPYSCNPVFLPKGNQFKYTKQACFFARKQPNGVVEELFWRVSTLREEIFDEGKKLGFKDTLEFVGSTRNAIVQANWVMREYSLSPVIFSEEEHRAIGNGIDNYVVCAIQYKGFSFDFSEDEELFTDYSSKGELSE